MKVKSEYTAREIEACVIVMRELFTYLKPYRNQIVLIGGWVPYFLLEKYSPPGSEYDQHVGSLDIDVALDAFSIPESAYKTILEILKEREFYHRKDNLGKDIPASFLKKVFFEDGEEIEVQIDFLAPESVLSELRKLGNHGLMREALRNIEDQFKDVKSIGPVSVARFMGLIDKDEYDRITRDAYELLQFIIQGMGKEQ